MRQLFAWAISFSRQDQLVNRAVHELSEIARQKVNLAASMSQDGQWQGYQQARLRRFVREYLDSLARAEQWLTGHRRQKLAEIILERLSTQKLVPVPTVVPMEPFPRKAA